MEVITLQTDFIVANDNYAAEDCLSD